MQLREKIGKMFMVGFEGIEPPKSLINLIQNYFIGGVILYNRNIKSRSQLARLIQDIKDAADGRPILIGIDEEGGRVTRLPPPSTQWPPMAHVTNANAAYTIGKKMAEELRSIGFNLNFAPVLDVNTNIKNPIIGDRSFSSDPYIVANLGAQIIKGLQDNGVIACGKHFPGHGDTSEDSHLSLPILPHTLERLKNIELVPFATAIETGVKSIMTAHIIFEGLDDTLPATMSPVIINSLLRKDLGYNGVVFTDDLEMAAIASKWGHKDAALKSFMAGCDICLICRSYNIQKEAIEYIISSVSAGTLPESRIEETNRRIARLFNILS